MSRDNPFSAASGTEIFIRDLAVDLVRRGNAISIVCGQNREVKIVGQHIPSGLNIHEIALKLPLLRWFSFSRKSGSVILEILNAGNVEAIVAFGARSFPSRMFRTLRHRRRTRSPRLYYYAIDSMRSEYMRTKRVLATRGIIAFLESWMWHMALIHSDRGSTQLSDMVFASCKDTSDRIQTDYATDGRKVAVVYLGVLDNYASGYDSKNESRPFQNHTFLHVCSEANAERRGTLYFLEALRLLQEKYGMHPRGIIVGPCYTYKQFAYGLDVEFIDRRAANRSMQYYYSKCDAVVLPSLSEGFCLPVVEAMMFGKPVIASSVGSLPELIEDGVSGFLVAPGDVSSLAEKMRLAVSDRSLEEKMRANCKATAKKYTISRTADVFSELLMAHMEIEPEVPYASERG